jgi:peptidoglycan hydrolase CwlO-like protein
MAEENKNLEENIKRHIDVMLENVRSDFKVFGEKLSSVEEKVDLLVEDMDYVKSEIVEIKDRFKETDRAAESHEKRIIKLENTVLAKA